MIKLIYKINSVTNRSEQNEKELFKELNLEYIKDEDFKWVPAIKDHPINDQFIVGLIDGDGSFFITFHPDFFLRPGFNISQNRTKKRLLDKVLEFFKCGEVQTESDTLIKYRITNFKEIFPPGIPVERILAQLIPFCDKYRFYTLKRDHYRIFREVCMIKGNREERLISLDDKFKIIDLAYNMNKEGTLRKMTKEEYIKAYFPESY